MTATLSRAELAVRASLERAAAQAGPVSLERAGWYLDTHRMAALSARYELSGLEAAAAARARQDTLDAWAADALRWSRIEAYLAERAARAGVVVYGDDE